MLVNKIILIFLSGLVKNPFRSTMIPGSIIPNKTLPVQSFNCARRESIHISVTSLDLMYYFLQEIRFPTFKRKKTGDLVSTTEQGKFSLPNTNVKQTATHYSLRTLDSHLL